METRNYENFLSFSDISVSIGSIILSLLRRAYLALTVSVLANRLKLFHITKTDFFRLNCLHSDQYSW